MVKTEQTRDYWRRKRRESDKRLYLRRLEEKRASLRLRLQALDTIAMQIERDKAYSDAPRAVQAAPGLIIERDRPDGAGIEASSGFPVSVGAFAAPVGNIDSLGNIDKKDKIGNIDSQELIEADNEYQSMLDAYIASATALLAPLGQPEPWHTALLAGLFRFIAAELCEPAGKATMLRLSLEALDAATRGHNLHQAIQTWLSAMRQQHPAWIPPHMKG